MQYRWLIAGTGMVLAGMALAAPAWAQMYQWVDARGITHVSNEPPAAVAPVSAPASSATVERKRLAIVVQPVAPRRGHIIAPKVAIGPSVPTAVVPSQPVATLAQPVSPVATPATPVTAQIFKSSRNIQVINGSRLSEAQQLLTTSVVMPHAQPEGGSEFVQDTLERQWDRYGERQLY